MFKCLFGHEWMTVESFSNIRLCKMCRDGKCFHSLRVCMRCGKVKGYGSHGELTVIPDSCKAQITYMRLGTNYKGKVGEIC